MSPAVVQRGLPLLLALGLDAALGEPPAVMHPVVWMGRLAAALERRTPRSAHARLVYGACGAGSIAGASILAGHLVEQVVGRLHPLPRLLALSWLLKSTVALRSLAAAAEAVRAPLQRHDLAAARAALRRLVGRDVATLGPSLLAAAAVEAGPGDPRG